MITQRQFDRPFRAAAIAIALVAGTWASGAAAQDAVSFKEDVYPIIEVRCLACHKPGGDGYEASGLDLRTYEGLMKGTELGAIVKPGRAIESTLVAVIDQRTHRKIWMPQDRRRLSKCERLLVRFWVNQGARDN